MPTFFTFPDSVPWPQFGRTSKPDYGQEEAAEVFGNDPRMYSVTAQEFIGGADRRVSGTQLVDVDWSSGKPEPISGSKRTISSSLVLLSMGFLGPEDYILDKLSLDRDERSNVASPYGKFTTNVEGIFEKTFSHISLILANENGVTKTKVMFSL